MSFALVDPALKATDDGDIRQAIALGCGCADCGSVSHTTDMCGVAWTWVGEGEDARIVTGAEAEAAILARDHDAAIEFDARRDGEDVYINSASDVLVVGDDLFEDALAGFIADHDDAEAGDLPALKGLV